MVNRKTVQNPLVLAAGICAVLIYSGIVPVKNRTPFCCCLPLESVVMMSGKIISNPVKTGKSGAYRALFKPQYAVSSSGMNSTCSGSLVVMIDGSMAESFSPGKLYSDCRKNGSLICETGANMTLAGTGRNGVFFADSGKMKNWDDSLNGMIAHFRALCRIQFRRLMYAWGEAGGLLLALLSGAREYTGKDTADAFRNAGLSHILALSGMHLSLVSGLALFISSHTAGKKAAFFFQAVSVLLFVWFAGLSPSLLRALLCSIIMLGAAVCSFGRIDMLTVICASFLLHAVIAPADVSEAAFMLSYGALAGILVFGEGLRNLFASVIPDKIAADVSASAAAQLFTAPVSLKLFGTFMPGGIAASVAVSPLVTLFMYSGIACIALCMCIPFLVVPAGYVMNVIFTIIKSSVMLFARIPGIAAV